MKVRSSASSAEESTSAGVERSAKTDALSLLSLEVRHLRLVTAIAREGSLTKAGGRLHLTQSALSHQLQEIEHRLGAALYHRVRRRLVPTEVGRRLIGAAPAILERLVDLELELRAHTRGSRGTIRVTVESYTCFEWLAPLLRVFARRYPAIEVSAVIDQAGRPLEALSEGLVDLALVKTPVDLTGLAATPLFEDELLLLVANDHKLAGRPWVDPDAVATERLLVHGDPERSRFYRHFLVAAGVRPRAITSVSPTDLVLGMVAADLGISALSDWTVRSAIREGALKSLQLGENGVRRTWFAVRRQNASEPEYLRHFVSLLPEHLAPENHDKRARRRAS